MWDMPYVALAFLLKKVDIGVIDTEKNLQIKKHDRTIN